MIWTSDLLVTACGYRWRQSREPAPDRQAWCHICEHFHSGPALGCPACRRCEACDYWKPRIALGILTHGPYRDDGEGYHYIGFDCGHASDVLPSMPLSSLSPGAVYRDLAFVMAEADRLAEQIAGKLSAHAA